MRILSFDFGDQVRITRTAIRGTVIRTGGKFAVVEFTWEGKKDKIRIELCRLRHTESLPVIALKQVKKRLTELKRKIQWTLRNF